MREEAVPIAHIVDEIVGGLLHINEKRLAMKTSLQRPRIKQGLVFSESFIKRITVLQVLRSIRIRYNINISWWPSSCRFDALAKASIQPLETAHESCRSQLGSIRQKATEDLPSLFRGTESKHDFCHTRTVWRSSSAISR
jgi:hypothetical protein